MNFNEMITAPIADLARIIDANQYADLTSLNELNSFTEYFRTELMIDPADTITDRESLIYAIANDIHDMIHNANTLDLIPDATTFSDDEINALSDRIDSDELYAALADIILARINS